MEIITNLSDNDRSFIELDMDGTPEVDDNTSEVNEPEMRIPVPVTNAKTSPLTMHIAYTDDLPEYPESHIDGLAYVVSARGRSRDELIQTVKDIQYAKHQKKGRKRPIYCPILSCHADRWEWTCSGIFACEYLNPLLLSCHHTSVDDNLWDKIRQTQQQTNILHTEAKRNSYSLFRSKTMFFQTGNACIDQLPTCRPVFKREHLPTVLGEHRPYIGCVNEGSERPRKHYRHGIMAHTQLDIAFLDDLFNKNLLPSAEECGAFEPLSSRRVYCGRDHPQGSGRLKHTKCGVTFNAFIPVDLRECPYILFISHGIHVHPPPPPTKAPERILQGVTQIIRQIQDPTMTTAQFLRSPELEAFCRQYGTSTLAEIHNALANKDKISAIIQKQRLLAYPKGHDVNGVLFLKEVNPLINDYIQEIFHDPDDIMIICGFKEQIKFLATLQSFEVDMAHKRVRSKNINEVLFATFVPDQCKVITLLRVFTNQNTSYGYYLLFKRVFTLISKVTKQPVLFNPIHGTGIYGIIVDMDNKQYAGLGKYLEELDPQHRSIQWQAQHILVFCRVHFQRTILNAIGTENRGTPLWSRMMSLLECKTEDEYDQLLDLLITHESDLVRNWAMHKKPAVIKAGLNEACSKIPSTYFRQLRNHTNAVEQSHYKSNAWGRHLNLVEAIKNSAKLDKDDIIQYQGFVNFNVHHSYRTSNMEANYLRHMQRDRSRKRQWYNAMIADEEETQRSQTPASPARTARCQSRSSQRSDTRSGHSTQSLRKVASTNALNLEQRSHELQIQKQEIEVKKAAIELKKAEEEAREQQIENDKRQLENEKLELDLMERRNRIQNAQVKE